jgi:hypothetical protein
MLIAACFCWRSGILIHGPLLGWGQMRSADFAEMTWDNSAPFLMPKDPPASQSVMLAWGVCS